MDLASDITSEDLQAFLQEAEEHLQVLDEDIVRLEREQGNEELLQEIFRAAHTLKGSSAMLGHQRMADLAHAMESVLDKVRKHTLEVTTPVVDALLHSLDNLNLLKEELVSSDATPVDITLVVGELEDVAESGDSSRGPAADVDAERELRLDEEALAKSGALQALGQTTHHVRVQLSRSTEWAAVRCFQVLDALRPIGDVLASAPTEAEIREERAGHLFQIALATDASPAAIRDAVLAVGEVEDVVAAPYVHVEEQPLRPEADGVPEAVAAGAREAAAPGSRQRRQASQTVRVDVERLDNLMDMVGELIIDRTRIIEIGKALEAQYGDNENVQALAKTSQHIVRVVDELQESTMQVRMLPIGNVFSGFTRMMRDLSQRMQKKTDFIVDGQDTEIDRTVVDRIRDPLVHLLRNSLDHGIEPPKERKKAGKDETGTIKLSAFHEQGHIVITVEDDGRGIDPQRIRDSAVKKQLMSAEAASRLSDAEAIDLIFLPGSSTAEKATDVSGRGVGMDIVKSNIQAINGFVNVDTSVGEGTKFTLRLPLTLATLQALLVHQDDTIYAVPVVYVVESVAVNRSDITFVDGGDVFRMRGNVVPLVYLREALGLGSDARGESDRIWVVVVQFAERYIGLGVESLMQLQEIVVKSLGSYIGDVKGVAGASILGDGRAVLILDVPSLMQAALQR